MKAWVRTSPGTLELKQVPVPEIAPEEILVRVLTCGVCRTDLHVIDGELPEHKSNVIPGHQIIGTVVGVGDAVRSVCAGERVGIPWLRRTCGTCEWCRKGRENLCPNSSYTGWDADGGFAEYAVAPAAFVYPLGDADPVETAPLLCAGIIGYRALKRACLEPGGNLGIYGYGSSGHLTATLAAAQGARIFVMTRGKNSQALAQSLPAAFVGAQADMPPELLDSAIIFAPAGDLVPVALAAVKPGGTVVSAGIHMSKIPSLDYDETLFRERDLRTVTANTRADGTEFLRLASQLEIRPQVTTYSFDETGKAVDDLRAGRAAGSLVIAVSAE